MHFNDICLLTDDVLGLCKFYGEVLQAEWEGDAVHAFVKTDGTGMAVYSKQAAEKDMGFDFSVYGGSGTIVLGFNVEDVDLEYERLKADSVSFILPPTTYPWGARSMHFRDPDGNIVCMRTLPKR